MKLPLALLSLGVCFADTYPRQPGVDVQHYTFRVTLSDENDEVQGDTTVVVRFTAGVREFALDLAAPMTVTAVSPGAYRRQPDRVVIVPEPAPKPGELREFTVKYHGVPADGLKILKNKYGERCFFSANWPDLAHQWLPTIDHPYDKATSEFIVTAPAKYQVVANGVLVEEDDLGDGRRLTHWKQSVPISTWLNCLGVAQFASRRFGKAAGVPLETWVYHQDRDAGIATFEEPMRQAIEFYNSHIGKYPYGRLAGVQSAGNGGGMEHATAVFYGQATVTGRPAFSLVAHEVAHQWWGDSVTEKDWDDVWLSEGFATYFTLLATEHYLGRDAFLDGLKRSRSAIFSAEKRLPGVAVVQLKPWKGIPNAIVYQKGGWALHMLRGQVGTAKFWAGMREYYRRYRDANASTADFRKVMEEVSGADLGWFFDQWLYRAGSPALEGAWTYNQESKRVAIELKQKQPGDAYRLPLQIVISPGGSDRPAVSKVEMTERQQRFEIPCDRPPAAVDLDPDLWVLMDAKFSKR